MLEQYRTLDKESIPESLDSFWSGKEKELGSFLERINARESGKETKSDSGAKAVVDWDKKHR